jgi:hypothetical protein
MWATSASIQITGPVSRTWMGGSVRSAGDVNGDGHEDVIVGRHSEEGGGFAPPGSTAAVVLFGSTSLADTDVATMTPTQGFRIWPSGDSDGSGNSVDGVGDVNGDGYGDVIVASSWAAPNDRPVAHVILGRAHPADVNLGAFTSSDGWSIRAPGLGNLTAVSGAGDVNGDGYADVLVSFEASPNGRPAAGSVFLIYGSKTHANVDLAVPAPGFVRFDGAEAYAGLGSVLGFGDVNGDSRPDLVIRATQAVGAVTGAIYVVWGRPGLTDIDLAHPPAGAVAVVEAPLDRSQGIGTMAVADVNGDGRMDVVVGDPGYQKDGDPYSRHGSVDVLLGGAPFPAARWRIIGAAIHDQLGGWVAARDMNGDGRAEIATSVGFDAPPGAVYVVAGRTATSDLDLSIADPTAWSRIDAPAANEEWGVGIGIADVTGDHVPDLLVGAPAALLYTGRVYITRGSDTRLPTTTRPSNTFLTASVISGGRVAVGFRWTGSDLGSGVARYEASQSTDGASWTTITTTLLSPSLTRSLSPGHTYRLRVRAIDRAGNVGLWTYGASFHLTARQESNSAIKWRGTWYGRSSAAYWAGHERSAMVYGATASLTFTGRSFAWVASRSVVAGSARIYVNGTYIASVNLHAASSTARVVMFSKAWTTAVTRTVTVRVLGTIGHPRVNVDAFVTGS